MITTCFSSPLVVIHDLCQTNHVAGKDTNLTFISIDTSYVVDTGTVQAVVHVYMSRHEHIHTCTHMINRHIYLDLPTVREQHSFSSCSNINF